MKVKGIVEEDYSNYKKCSMFIIFPSCSLKCDQENGNSLCQNSTLLDEPDIEISYKSICEKYIQNPLSHALVLGGLEPFDSFDDLVNLLVVFRHDYHISDDVVIYTGYTEEEIQDKIAFLAFKSCVPLLIKFGRFRPNQSAHYDELLGVDLMNDEQYSKWVGLCQQ